MEYQPMRKRAVGKMVIGNILATAAMRHPDDPAFYCAETKRRFTFREVDARTNRLAQALLALGLRKGDVVAFLASNRAEIVEIYFALARTGIIGLPLSHRLADVELIALTGAMGATALVHEGRFAAAATHICDALPGIRHRVSFGGDGSGSALDYEQLLAAASPQAPEIDIEEDDPFYFSLTSGTTGLPKSYIVTHYNNVAIGSFLRAVEMTKRDVVMTVFPTSSRVGFGWIVSSVLYGACNVLVNFEPDAVLGLIASEGVTIVNLVPTMAAMLLPAQRSRPRALHSLRAIVFAGASLPVKIREQATAELCHDVYEYYGMNEAGIMVLSTPADRAKRPNSVGKPITFSEVTIVDDAGVVQGANESGEILVRSPMAATAYFDSPERSAETFRDGWIHTGDLGYFDEEGFLFIHGRKKDMIVSGGQNVYAAEVEDVILRCPGVADCAVFGLPDDFWGERVASVVIARSNADLTAAALQAFCRQHLAGFKIPKDIMFETEALPRNATGKVQKFLLAERFGGGRDTSDPPIPLAAAARS
jgi:fatty-acyl-CoA synthase